MLQVLSGLFCVASAVNTRHLAKYNTFRENFYHLLAQEVGTPTTNILQQRARKFGAFSQSGIASEQWVNKEIIRSFVINHRFNMIAFRDSFLSQIGRST